jgi:hypothetical protein
MTAFSSSDTQQLHLELTGRAVRRRRDAFWDIADVIDTGGPTLRAVGRGVRLRLDVDQTASGQWIAEHDIVLDCHGSSGRTRPHPGRSDALAAAAYEVARLCWSIQRGTKRCRDGVRASAAVLRWLEDLDLL